MAAGEGNGEKFSSLLCNKVRRINITSMSEDMEPDQNMEPEQTDAQIPEPDEILPEREAAVTDRAELNKRIDRAIHRIARGDREAIGEIYDLTGTAVYGFILSMLKNREDAEDVLQDTYVKISTNADQYHEQGKPMAWILTIARNLSLMLIRSRKRYQDLEDYEWEAITDERTEVKSEDKILVETLMKELKDEERQIVTLHAVSGLKHREIAQMLDIPLATVLSKYNRAIKKMQKALG